MNNFINNRIKLNKKVVFIMGTTGARKSRLSIDLATQLSAEIINFDKMQIYKGLNIITDKITESEKKGVPHYLLGAIDPDVDFIVEDFCVQAIFYIEIFLDSGHVPIIIGGSNSYIEKLVEDPMFIFKSNYDHCFIWIDVDLSILDSFVRTRVDQMVHAGLVDEARNKCIPDADYTKGIRQSIGILEMDKYLREESVLGNDEKSKKKMLLQSAIEEIKFNTCKLIRRQLEKIHLLKNEKMWLLHRIDATHVVKNVGKQGANDAWKEIVLNPCLEIVEKFLKKDDNKINIEVVETNAI